MAFEISTVVNYLLIAFIAMVFVVWFVDKAKEIIKKKPANKEEENKPKEPIAKLEDKIV